MLCLYKGDGLNQMRRQLKVWVFFEFSFSLEQFNADGGSKGVGPYIGQLGIEVLEKGWRGDWSCGLERGGGVAGKRGWG